MSTSDTSAERRARDQALEDLVTSAASNIPGVDFASITIAKGDQTLRTAAATDSIADEADAVQYELREGPCYAAVTDERVVLLNDVADATDYPRYGPRAVDLGVRSQLAIQLLHNGERAGLNLYARKPDAFDRSTIQLAELFATAAATTLSYAEQVEQLGEALHTRTDIGTAVGILMERYSLPPDKAFGFMVRHSNQHNIKLRLFARQVIDGTFTV
jgi:GAF domain-containing protein